MNNSLGAQVRAVPRQCSGSVPSQESSTKQTDWSLLLLVPSIRDGHSRVQPEVWYSTRGLPQRVWGVHVCK